MVELHTEQQSYGLREYLLEWRLRLTLTFQDTLYIQHGQNVFMRSWVKSALSLILSLWKMISPGVGQATSGRNRPLCVLWSRAGVDSMPVAIVVSRFWSLALVLLVFGVDGELYICKVQAVQCVRAEDWFGRGLIYRKMPSALGIYILGDLVSEANRFWDCLIEHVRDVYVPRITNRCVVFWSSHIRAGVPVCLCFVS